ncbi:MAG: hypothetical protein WBD31_19470 [Rubripirellula sp.]
MSFVSQFLTSLTISPVCTANPCRFSSLGPIPAIASGLACGLLLVISSGCSNRAHRDIYAQRMMSESRVLEDQLYAADYENRVLRDRLEQYQRKVAAARVPTPSTMQPHDHPDALGGSASAMRNSLPPSPYADPAADLPTFDMGEGLEGDEYEMPMFDEGEPVDAGAIDPDAMGGQSDEADEITDGDSFEGILPEPKRTNPNALRDPEPLDAPSPVPDPLSKPNIDALNADDIDESFLLPAPGGPVPPGKNDLMVPPIEEGDVLPPPLDGKDAKPPGQIMLPDALQAAQGLPEKLQIHPVLSVGHHTDGELDGAVIVVNAIDATGRPVDIADFNIEAELSVVVLDPSRPSEEAMIGRWDFDRWQVQGFVRQHPVSGLHVPIQWKDEIPNGEDVVVHVRLRGEDNDMRCESELRLADKEPISDWTPRARALR